MEFDFFDILPGVQRRLSSRHALLMLSEVSVPLKIEVGVNDKDCHFQMICTYDSRWALAKRFSSTNIGAFSTIYLQKLLD